jgi:hypothetical protein
MSHEDIGRDPVLAALRDLPAHDVDDIRAHRLRRRCRAALTTRPPTRTAIAARDLASLPWRRLLGPALVAMWGALYVIETLRQAMVIYRP